MFKKIATVLGLIAGVGASVATTAGAISPKWGGIVGGVAVVAAAAGKALNEFSAPGQ